jgi:hypothetical protein
MSEDLLIDGCNDKREEWGVKFEMVGCNSNAHNYHYIYHPLWYSEALKKQKKT